MSHSDFGRPPYGYGDVALARELGEFEASAPPWPRAPAPVSQQPVAPAHGDQPAVGQYLADPYVGEQYLTDELAAVLGEPGPRQERKGQSAPADGQPGRGWLVLGAAVVAAGAGITAVIMLTGGHQAGPVSRVPA